MNNADMPIAPITKETESMDGAFLVGLNKREYFAGLAMQGLSTATSEDGTWQHEPRDCAIAAVEYADAMLAELERTK